MGNNCLEWEIQNYKIEYEETVKRTYASVDRDDDLPEIGNGD